MRICVHGINFDRIGECTRCGACEKRKCPHWKMEDGISTCDTYGTGDYLERHCNVFPDSPFCRVVAEGICGFKFKPVTEQDEKKYVEFRRKWAM